MLHSHIARRILRKDLDAAENHVVLHYEEFVQSPDNYLDQVYDLVELERFTPTGGVSDHNRRYFDEWESQPGDVSRLLEPILSQGPSQTTSFDYFLSKPYITSPS